jgi:hypothetical protein
LATVYFGKLFENYKNNPIFATTFFHCKGYELVWRKTVWATDWAIFSQTHLVTLITTQQQITRIGLN